MKDEISGQQKTGDPETIFAQISIAYVEILAGIRTPEQLARWLSDKSYYDLVQKVRREVIARQVTGAMMRPQIAVRKSQIFLTDQGAFQSVVVLLISGATRAVSIRAEQIHGKYRVTDIVLI